METEKFVQKPSFVEAVQLTAQNLHEVAEWCGGSLRWTHRPPEATLTVPNVNGNRVATLKIIPPDSELISKERFNEICSNDLARYGGPHVNADGAHDLELEVIAESSPCGDYVARKGNRFFVIPFDEMDEYYIPLGPDANSAEVIIRTSPVSASEFRISPHWS